MRDNNNTVDWITLPPPKRRYRPSPSRDPPLLPLPPPPRREYYYSPMRGNNTVNWIMLPPPQRRYRSPPRRDYSPLPPPPPQHRRYYSPRQDSPPDSIDSSSSSFRSSGPFFRRDSESESRGMSTSYWRNYHQYRHQGSERSYDTYRGRDERNIYRRDSELEPHRHRDHRSRSYHRPRRQGSEGLSPYRERGAEKYEKTTKAEEVNVSGVKRSSKILIKIPGKNIKPAAEEKSAEKKPEEKKHKEKRKVVEEVKKDNIRDEKEEGEINEEDDVKSKEEDDGDLKMVEEGEKSPRVDEKGDKNRRREEEVRVWNLRPRRPTGKGKEGGNKAPLTSKNAEENKGKSGGEKKKLHKVKISLNVALTKKEIEEDFIAWSGAKLSRRPQKRAKHVQKSLDTLFPGLHLTGISVDSYKS